MSNGTGFIPPGLRWVGITLSGLSIFNLIRHGLDVGLGPTVALVVEAYEHRFSQLIGWIAPPLNEWLANLQLGLQLQPQWRDIAVPIMLYMFSDAISNFTRAAPRRINGSVLIALSPALAAASCVQFSPAGTVANLAVPMIGLTVFATIQTFLTSTFYRPTNQTWTKTVGYYLRTTVLPFVVVTAVALGALQLGFVRTIGVSESAEATYLVVLGLFVILIAAYLIIRGATLPLEGSESRTERFRRSGSGPLGVNILWAIVVAIFFLIANAGDRL